MGAEREGDMREIDASRLGHAIGRLDESTVHVPEIEREMQHVEAAAELMGQLVASARSRFAPVLDEQSDRASAVVGFASQQPSTHVGGRLSSVGERLNEAASALSEMIDRCAL